ncbi:MAG: glycoside hydrolase family 16 protein [Nocardioidaceae bacterium]|nr:glycoside hydrolase family 16 protein [Nocardioidaceae bacterium]
MSSGSTITGSPRLQSAARQSAKVLMHPQLAQPGSGVQRSAKAKSAMSAVFKPARKGRTVVLQRKKGTSWVSVAKRRQNGRGIAEFTAPYKVKGKVAVYRASAVRYRDQAQVTSRGVKTSRWGRADFTDEFAKSTLSDNWTDRLQGYQPESSRQCSKADPRARRVVNGAARISVLDDPSRGRDCSYEGTNYDWRLNGHIGTQFAKSFRYGYAAARMKFQPRRGQHASFWMQPETVEAVEGSADKTGAEVDIIEWFGGDHPSGGLTSFIYHYPDNGRDGVTGDKVGGFIKQPGRFGGDWAKKYHVFSVEWTPQRYIFRIDGKETFRTSKGVSGQPQFLILSLLSSDYELPLLEGDNRLPQHMFVDWVRYWER